MAGCREGQEILIDDDGVDERLGNASTAMTNSER